MESNVLELILDGKSKPTNIRLSILENITGNFSEEREIGQGGSSTVYKGVLPNGNVAVKKFKYSQTINEKIFYREVNSLLDVSHKNVVRFLGYCANTENIAIEVEGSRERIFAEQRERILCFEYINNGNLNNHITDELRGLEWDTRYQMIKQICDGLHYLHMEKQIIHMDLKSENILVDNHMVPKITDFGLSRLDDKSQTMSTDRFASLGYCAPEYIYGGRFSFKCDIYSLGVLIIELVTGLRGFPNKNDVLRRWRHRWTKSGKGTPLGYQQIAKCIELGTLCVEIDPSKRPFIWEVLCDINEFDATSGKISNVDEQIISSLEDDMLGIEPLQLHFPFELNKQISSSIELTNNTGSHIAFIIINTSPLPYRIEPTRGIVLPRSGYTVKITLESLEVAPRLMKYACAIMVQSTKARESLAVDDITDEIFTEGAGNVVDELVLDVVFDTDIQNQNLGVHDFELSFPFEHDNLTPMVLPLEFLRAITYDFSAKSELGRGGYGVVYKGVLPSGKIIAVKKLFEVNLLKEETFQNEVSYLTGIKHRNVVQFVGYCAESSWELIDQPSGKPVWAEIPKRLLCFEYVRNKSLDKYISDESLGLEWNMRYKIIKGICSGLHFLHEEHHIVHLDLKPENIMMDAAMMPKITDFGLSRIFGNQETRIITDNRPGSRGYMAPEYMFQGIVSIKADIFSLGVVIIQIVTGRKEYPLSNAYFQLPGANDSPNQSSQDFIKKVVENWSKEFISAGKYQSVKTYTRQVKQCITIALKCVEHDMENRPTAKDIIQRLDEEDHVFITV